MRETADRSAVALTVRARFFLVTVFVVCVSSELAFVWLDYYVNYAAWTDIGAIQRLFNITREDSLSSWFASTQTFLVALTLWLLWRVARRQGAARWETGGWFVLAVFFTWMAVDDGAKIHERIGTAVRVLMEEADARLIRVFPSYTWQLVFLPLLAGLGLFTLLFLFVRLADPLSRGLVVSALGCLVVAVGLDFVEGLDRKHPWNIYPWVLDRLDLWEFSRRRFGRSGMEVARHFSKSIEETLEMFGNTLFWILFLRHLMQRTGALGIEFRGGGVPALTRPAGGPPP